MADEKGEAMAWSSIVGEPCGVTWDGGRCTMPKGHPGMCWDGLGATSPPVPQSAPAPQPDAAPDRPGDGGEGEVRRHRTDRICRMVVDPAGEWVHHDDHARALAAERERAERAEAEVDRLRADALRAGREQMHGVARAIWREAWTKGALLPDLMPNDEQAMHAEWMDSAARAALRGEGGTEG